ncbi:hypothetical protein ONZ45_g1122 [Pleurotus djamor]|nr:hypothetical protein ONZ45_g1122 [Pleurotus djamor]
MKHIKTETLEFTRKTVPPARSSDSSQLATSPLSYSPRHDTKNFSILLVSPPRQAPSSVFSLEQDLLHFITPMDFFAPFATVRLPPFDSTLALHFSDLPYPETTITIWIDSILSALQDLK